MKNKYFALFQNEDSVRKLSLFHSSETGGFDPIAIACYSEFTAHEEGYIQNGVWPIIKAEDFKHLEGKLLTIVDATFSDPKQREAFKAVVKSELREWYNIRTNGAAMQAEHLKENVLRDDQSN